MVKFNKISFILFLSFLLVGNLMVFLRPIYMDEGFYMYVANNIFNGELLYKDIIYHQTPVFVYVYSLFSGFGFLSYILLRYLSFLLTFAAVLMVYFHVYKLTRNTNSANAAIFFVIFNGLFLNWNLEVKMYPLLDVLFYGAFFISTILAYNNSPKDLFLCFLAGLLSGLAVNTRFVYGLPCLVLVVFIIYKLFSSGSSIGNSLKYIVLLGLGLLLSSGLTLYFLAYYTNEFFFGVYKVNLYAEQIKWGEESNILLWIKFFFTPQNFILMIFLFVSFRLKFEHKIYVYFIILSLILVNSFGYHVNEYLVVIVPFIAYVIGMCFIQLREKLKFKKVNLPGLVLIIYLIGIFSGIPYFKQLAEGKTLFPNLIAFKEVVDYERSLPGKSIIASWYNFSLFSNKKEFFKNEYIYSFILDKPSEEEMVRFSLPDSSLLRKQINDKFYDVVVFHRGVPFLLYRYINDIKTNYHLRKTFGDIEIYTKD